MDTLERKSRV